MDTINTTTSPKSTNPEKMDSTAPLLDTKNPIKKRNSIDVNENEPLEDISYVSTGTGFFLGLWKPGQILSTDVPQSINQTTSLSVDDFRSLIVVTLLALAIRLWDISAPPEIVYEEIVHLHRINNYLTGKFFYDLNPPLSTQFYTVLSQLFGYTGRFPLNSQSYIGHSFPFIQLRSAIALLGVISVVLTFLTLKLTGASRMSSMLGAIFVAVESTFVLQHRYIFTFPIYLTCLSGIIYFWKRLEVSQPLKLSWHINAITLGTILGLAVSTVLEAKYTILWIVLASAYQLWWSFGNKYDKKFMRKFFGNILFRLLYFGFIPMVIYHTSIAVHLSLTPVSGEGDSLLSGPFQYSLLGSPGSKVVAPVGLGSYVTLRHLKTNVYLHSHEYYYPLGSYQQQITGYGYRDSNNYWYIENITETESSKNTFQALQNKAFIRLRHIQTGRRLHSHEKPAHVSNVDWQYEVSAYGAEGYPGDLNDLWQVEIVPEYSQTAEAKKSVNAITSRIRLRHVVRDCYLLTHQKKLPPWAFGQQEVTCAKGAKIENTLWYVETNYHPKHPSDAPFVSYTQPMFSEKIDEYKEVMKKAKESVEEENTAYSLPYWLLPFSKQVITVHRNHHRQLLLMGNFVVWYSSSISMIFYILFKLYSVIAIQRGWTRFQRIERIKEFDHHVGSFFFLWMCHYVPMVLTKNSMTLLDYIPSLYCTILCFTRFWDFVQTTVLRRKVFMGIFTSVFITLSVSFFLMYSPFVYNGKVLTSQCRKLELNGALDLSCIVYLPTEEMYDAYDNEHFSEIHYQYKAPPKEEQEKATMAINAPKPNPTQALDKKRIFTPEEMNMAIEKYKNVTDIDPKHRERLLFLEHHKNIVEERNKKMLEAQGKKIEEKKDKIQTKVMGETNSTTTINLDNVSRIQAQWIRITDPPNVNFTESTFQYMMNVNNVNILSKNSTNAVGIDSNTPKDNGSANEGEIVETNRDAQKK